MLYGGTPIGGPKGDGIKIGPGETDLIKILICSLYRILLVSAE